MIDDVKYPFELAGCKSFRTNIESNKWKNLKLCCFGHIHFKKYINPPGVFNYKGIQFSNASALEGGNFDKGVIHHGNIINI